MHGIFHNFWKNLRDLFQGRNLLWQILAIGLTFIFVGSGFDWKYFQLTRNPVLESYLFPAVLLGALVPLFGILIFLAVSSLAKKPKMVWMAYAVGQAAILGLLVSDFYKFFTGRPGPHEGFQDSFPIMDISHVFRFGILRGGVFFGWPSSHTAIATAMAAALWTLFPKNKTVKLLSAAYALYVGIGVSVTIHWFSDFAAGAIIGAVIGTVVGESFRKQIAV